MPRNKAAPKKIALPESLMDRLIQRGEVVLTDKVNRVYQLTAAELVVATFKGNEVPCRVKVKDDQAVLVCTLAK